jgi:hypothetical protein
MHWLNSYAIQDALTAYHHWFVGSEPAGRSLQDLNYLAHALWSGQQYTEASQVFQAMGRHVTPRPWQYRVADPGDKDQIVEHITRCRAQSMGVAERGSRAEPAPNGKYRNRSAP